MRTALPLSTLALCCSLAATPARAANGHEAHRERARSHDEPGARDGSHDPAERTRAEAERARAAHARAEAERARAAHARAEAERARAAHARQRAAHHRHAPAPRRHVVVQSAPARPAAPALDRTGEFSLGLTGGSYVSGYERGESYGDLGVGLVGAYRVAPPLGFELAWSHYRDAAGERATSPLSLSAVGFGFPEHRVSPYALVGVTFTGRDVSETFCEGDRTRVFTADDSLFGPHAGLGVEIALGQHAAIDLEGRLTTYLDVAPEDPTVPAAIQALAGFNFYF